MRQNIKKFIAIFVTQVVVLVGLVQTAFAQNFTYRIPNPSRFNNLEEIISAAGSLIRPLFLITFGIILLVGAYLLLISRGNPEKIEEARNTFIAGIVGFALAVLAPTLVNLVTSILGVEGFSF